jgi:PAS domain S-box-containing protein
VFVKDDRRRWVCLNEACATLFGLSAPEVLGRADDEIFSEDLARTFRSGDTSLLESGMQETIEANLPLSRGGRTVSMTKSLLVEPDGRRYIVVTVRDITDRSIDDVLLGLGDAEQRLGQRLHDEIGQRLTGVALLLRAFIDRLDSIAPQEAENASAILKSLREAIGSIRELSRSLTLVSEGETDLLRALAGQIAMSNSALELQCELIAPEVFDIGEPAKVAALCRLTREALAIAVRQGRARRAMVRVARTDHAGVLEIETDGERSNDGSCIQELTMSILRRRADLVGGTLTMRLDAEGGRHVVCTFPVE